jgi:hypothetical protein
MRKQSGGTVITFIAVVLSTLLLVIGVSQFFKRNTAEKEYAATLLDNQRKQKEATAAAAAKVEAEAKAATELELQAQQRSIELCHSAIIKRAKYESKAKVTQTEIRRETEKNNIGGSEMYVVTGKMDLMNGYGAMLPNNYICRVRLSGAEFVRNPSVASEADGDNPERVELNNALKALGLDPNSIN